MNEIRFRPIGQVSRASGDEDVRDRTLISKVVIREDLADALTGIEDFSHIFVVFYMHKITDRDRLPLKVFPRGRTDLPLLGVYATRTAFRLNPIGITLVELLERKRNVLFVKGLDAFDGTPVLDLKPADAKDMIMNPRVPAWCSELHRTKTPHGSVCP